MSLLDTARLRKEARYLFWGWTILSSIAATIGGVVGWISIENDRT